MSKFRKKISVSSTLLFLLFATATAIKMGEKAVQLPIGTKIEKAGELTRFLLADRTIELIGLAGELGVRAYNKDGKLLYAGKQAWLFAAFPIAKLANQNVVPDDLIFVQFKGLSPQPDPPGKMLFIPRGAKIERGKPGVIRFLLADGQMVVFTSTSTKGLSLGQAGIYDQAGKLLYTRQSGRLCHLLSIQSLRNKVAIDDDPAWVVFSSEPIGR